jgi:amidase
MTEEYWRWTAREAVDALAKGDVSSTELIKSAAARVEETDGAVNAMVTHCYDRAEAHAQAINDGEMPEGVLHGLPISVKDLNPVAGVRCTQGSPIFADEVPERSDIMVEILEDNGAVVIGKSNTPEFGAGANTFNEVFGATRNPWDTRMTCGGSSGGAAVNLATGQAWLATGSDLGGSLRIPAAFSGVVGLRPSPGRVANGPRALPFAELGVQGPMARNVGDVALMLDAMAGEHPGDPISIARPAYSFRDAAEVMQEPTRVAWSADMGVSPLDPEVGQICENAVEVLRGMGADITDSCPDFAGAQDAFQTLRAAGFAAGKHDLLKNYREQLKPEVIWNIEKGLALTADDIGIAQRCQGALYHQFVEFFENHDLLVTPTVMTPPFPVEQRYVTEVNGTTFDNYIDWLMHTFVLTLTSLPSISIPAGFTESGLPVGLQLVGPPRGEAKLLSHAAALEAELGLVQTVPMDPIVRH